MTTILDLLSEYEKRATPGPWVVDPEPQSDPDPGICVYSNHPDDPGSVVCQTMEPDDAPRDAALIALLRNHAADLLAVARAAQNPTHIPTMRAGMDALSALLADAPEDGA